MPGGVSVVPEGPRAARRLPALNPSVALPASLTPCPFPRGCSKWPCPSHNQWHSVRCDTGGHLALVPLSFLPRKEVHSRQKVAALPSAAALSPKPYPQPRVCGTEMPRDSDTWQKSPPLFLVVTLPIRIGLWNNIE